MTEGNLLALVSAARRWPVMAEMSPLALLCLPAEVEIVLDAAALVERLDDLAPHSELPVIVSSVDRRYQHRFKVWEQPVRAEPANVNRMLPSRLGDARRWLITHRSVAERIADDATVRHYRTIALLLVDGLSFEDTRSWPEGPQPCLVDGPSVTYGKGEEGQIIPEVGFSGIIGSPPLARRLVDVGIPHSAGFSYWDREQNAVSAHLFRGVPLTHVRSVSEGLTALDSGRLGGTYVQLVREGLDGLAHGRREVTPQEIEATVEAIHNDYRMLVKLVASTGLPGAVYLTADHGILWKTQHADLRLADGLHSRHPRYQLGACELPEAGVPYSMTGQSYTVYCYPHLGATIRANDSGVHGGLSYWESIVPFVRVEVNL